LSEGELERIRAAYQERDAGGGGASAWLERPYRERMQELEGALLEGLAETGADPAGARVLEVGCGSGYFLSRFLDYGAAHAAGIDLMEHRIAQARERDPRLELVAGDAARLPWGDRAFDLVAQFTCLSSVLNPELRGAIAAEMWRVLRPGGTLVSYDMTATPVAVRAFRRAAALRRHGAPPAGTSTRPIDAAELRQLFPSAEFALRRITPSTDVAGFADRNRALAALAAKLPLVRTHLLGVARKAA
jgi:ubiquinone/menaquinone biosynthesis C-methylase UbiE